MKIYILLISGHYYGVYRCYEAAREVIATRTYLSTSPDEYEIIEEYL